MDDKDLIAKVVCFAETAITDFMRNDDYDAAAIAFNMDAANNLVNISLASAANNREAFEEYKKLAYLSENLQPHKKYGNISKLPYNLEALWERPNIASLELLADAEQIEVRGEKRVKKFYKICCNAMLDFMYTEVFDKLRKEHERFAFQVINKGDSEDMATEYMRNTHKNRPRR